MKKALVSVALLAACLLSLRETHAVQNSYVATANATVQPAGPRTGTNGTNFFNIEGSANTTFSSFGVIDFLLSNESFGGTVTGVNSVTLNLTESNASFTAPGNFSVYVTDNTTTSIANNGTSPLFFTDSTNSGTVGTDTVGPVPPSPDTLFPLTFLGTFNFTTMGNTNNGQVDMIPLAFTGSSLTGLVNLINSNATLRLVLTPDDVGTAATFGGATNSNATLRQTLLIDANVAGLPYWDTNGSSPGLGGSGTWDTTTANFNDSTGTATPTVFDPSKLLIFAGTAGTVTIAAGGITENGGLQFNTDGYVIQGGTLTVGTNNSVTVGSMITTTVNSKISGANGLAKLGAGTLVLVSGANDFTGTVTVGGGTLQISSEANLGPTSNNLALSGGTLKIVPAGSFALDAARSLLGTGGAVDVGAGNTFTVNGSTNMTGSLTLPVAETVILAGGQKVMGGVTFASTGTLKAGVGGTDTIAMNGTITANNTTGIATINGNLDFGGTARSIAIAAGGKLVITGGITANGDVAGHVSVSGGGTLDIQGDNSNFLQPITIGSSGAAGPTVLVHDEFSLGFAPFADHHVLQFRHHFESDRRADHL